MDVVELDADEKLKLQSLVEDIITLWDTIPKLREIGDLSIKSTCRTLDVYHGIGFMKSYFLESIKQDKLLATDVYVDIILLIVIARQTMGRIFAEKIQADINYVLLKLQQRVYYPAMREHLFDIWESKEQHVFFLRRKHRCFEWTTFTKGFIEFILYGDDAGNHTFVEAAACRAWVDPLTDYLEFNLGSINNMVLSDAASSTPSDVKMQRVEQVYRRSEGVWVPVMRAELVRGPFMCVEYVSALR